MVKNSIVFTNWYLNGLIRFQMNVKIDAKIIDLIFLGNILSH